MSVESINRINNRVRDNVGQAFKSDVRIRIDPESLVKHVHVGDSEWMMQAINYTFTKGSNYYRNRRLHIHV